MQSVYNATSGRMPSAFWGTCPWRELKDGFKDGFAVWEDFVSARNVVANTAASAALAIINDQVTGFTGATAGTTITTELDEPYGALTLATTTDHESCAIQLLGGRNVSGQCVFEAGKKLWFEARIKKINVTDTKVNLFCGFMEEALMAEDTMIADAGTLADKDYVGFHNVEGSNLGAIVNAAYNTASGSTSPVVQVATAATLIADTYAKLGIYCDGAQVYFYGNGLQVGNPVLLTATDFPDGEEMAVYFAISAAHGDDVSATIDWVRVAQER